MDLRLLLSQRYLRCPIVSLPNACVFRRWLSMWRDVKRAGCILDDTQAYPPVLFFILEYLYIHTRALLFKPVAKDVNFACTCCGDYVARVDIHLYTYQRSLLTAIRTTIRTILHFEMKVCAVLSEPPSPLFSLPFL